VKASLRWVEGMQFVASAGSGHAIVVDGSSGVGGEDSGPRSMELLVMGLGGCTAMDVAFILRRHRQPFSGLEVFVNAERADTHPQVFTRIHIEYVVYGDVSEKAVQRAIHLSETKYCSASAMFGKTATITNSYHIIKNGRPEDIAIPSE